jgi:ABC-type uncharacterized transport system substrate-binding protein
LRQKNIQFWIKAYLLRVLMLLGLLVCLVTSATPVYATDYSGKRVMYIDSYHQEYVWSAKLFQGLQEGLDGSGATLAVHRMDTKRNRSIEFIKEAAKRAKAKIEEFAPDVVIISDDNAVKYLLQTYYKNTALPFVFCGVNWDATIYGLPYRNTTGMVEVGLIKPLIPQLRSQAKGERIGFLGLDSLSTLKNIKGHELSAGIHYGKVYLVDRFAAWKEKYLALQQEVDMVVLGNNEGIQGWNMREAIAFTRKHTRIPSGTLTPGRMEFSLLGYLRLPEEQGRWAAEAALKIMAGTPPSTIPVAFNQQGHLVINQALSEKLGIIFPATLFKRAEIVRSHQGRKVLYISSYYLDVGWSRVLHDTLLKTLEGSGVELKVFFIGAKRNRSPDYLKEKALEAKRLIETFSPEVVITSDDAAAKYVIANHYKKSSLPFVFSGVNWDVKPYDFSIKNTTGIVEVELIRLLLTQLKRYAKGPRLGWLSENSLTMRKNIEYHKKLFGVEYDKVYFVENFDDWKKTFIKLQDEVDMLVLQAPHAILGWDYDEAIAFTQEQTRIVTGSLTKNMMGNAVMGYVRLPEEHGEWVAQSVLQILDGTRPHEIPVAQNKKGRLMLNRSLLERLNLVVDRALYRRAEIVE